MGGAGAVTYDGKGTAIDEHNAILDADCEVE